MTNKLWIILIITGTLFTTGINSQEVIELKNASFEDLPRIGGDLPNSIDGWQDCGKSLFPYETPPDIHPVHGHAWQVSMHAAHGKTYLGLVTRFNGTYESVSQELERPLLKGKCYTLSVNLARSNSYLSPTIRSLEVSENFTFPIVFIIWAGNASCKKEHILAESPAVEHDVWRKYEFEFQASEDYDYITLQAYYNLPILAAYNGHVLVDGLSSILEVGYK